MTQRVAIYTRQAEAQTELAQTLRHSIESHGDTVVAIFADDARVTGRGKYAAWRELMSTLHGADRIVLASATDLPGRTVADLIKVLAALRDSNVHLHLYSEDIDTGSAGFALVAVAEAYRRAKLS